MLAEKRTKSGISDDDGSLTSTDLGKADVLNKFFISVSTHENTDTMPEMVSLTKGDPVNVDIKPHMISYGIKEIDSLSSVKITWTEWY